MRAPNALLLADADPDAGLGHVVRSTALACALARNGWAVEAVALRGDRRFELDGVEWATSPGDVVPGGHSPDVVIVDSYESSSWNLLGEIDAPVRVGFDDGTAPAEKTQLLIAPALDPRPPGGAPITLAGPRFACLRREYWEPRERQIAVKVARVLITTGWAMNDDSAAVMLALAAATAMPSAEIAVISEEDSRSRLPPGVSLLPRSDSLLEQLFRADIVVCSGGQTMLEAAATGAPLVAIKTADNQAAQIRMLLLKGAAVSASPENLGEALEDLVDSADRRRLSTRARLAVDGRGALRVASAIEDLWRAA